MMYLIILIFGIIGALLLMSRHGRTWQADGTWIYLALTVIAAGLAGWWLDARTGFTTLLVWGFTGSVTLKIGATLLALGTLTGVWGMATSAYKSGQFVS